MLASINVENAATIFHAADVHNAKSLREKCLNFVLGELHGSRGRGVELPILVSCKYDSTMPHDNPPTPPQPTHLTTTYVPHHNPPTPANFDPVTKSASFEEMGRTNVELVFEILQKR